MTVLGEHPELPSEQAYVDEAYRHMARMLEEVRVMPNTMSEEYEREVFERWQQARIGSLSDKKTTLVFGRIDEEAGDTHYVGRRHVRDEHYDTVVVDWRAPAATAFYQAGPRSTMGLRRRRQFLADGPRLLGIADDSFDTQAEQALDGEPVAPRRAGDILEAELRRQRAGHMRDIVATIQAEQDVVIRGPMAGIVVVQGGPGTGKTAVGLHRAAFLLYAHRRELERQGILVVGPNPVFVEYVSQVLPSLGEWAITQISIDDLAPIARIRGADKDETRKLKGDVRMAEVIARDLRSRRGVLDEDIRLEHEGVRFTVGAAEANADARELASRRAPYGGMRDVLRARLLERAWTSYLDACGEDRLTAPPDVVARAVRRDRRFTKALDRLWPAVSAPGLVRDLFASPARLRRAGDGLLDAAERRRLRRPRAPRGSDEAWTAADRALLDEAQTLIEGPPARYGHVVVDEAQDLSPMQARMLARRCPHGSMTVLGDLGQATGPWAHDAWDEVVEHLSAPDGHQVAELTLGYRLCSSIADLAAQVLSAIAPHLVPPTPVRADRGRVDVEEVPAGALVDAAAAAAARLASEAAGTAVLAAPEDLDEISARLSEQGVSHARSDVSGLHDVLTLVPADQAKGLEFDAVVLVEPGAVAWEYGMRMLYVTVTRAMRLLHVVHSEPLPWDGADAAPAAGRTAG